MSVATAGWNHFHPFPSSSWWSSLPLPLSRGFSSSSVSTAFPGSSGPRRWMPAGVVGDFVLVELKDGGLRTDQETCHGTPKKKEHCSHGFPFLCGGFLFSPGALTLFVLLGFFTYG